MSAGVGQVSGDRLGQLSREINTRREQVQAVLHQRPRTFGHPTSVWTLDLAADTCATLGITPRRVSDETIRLAIRRLGVRWQRAKQWITSPDPEYARKKGDATG